jgi:hypothetical protein
MRRGRAELAATVIGASFGRDFGVWVGGLAGFDGTGEDAEAMGEVGVLQGIGNDAALLADGEDSRAGEQGEMARDDGDIDRAAGCDFADVAVATALGDAGEEGEAGVVGEGSEKTSVEGCVDGCFASEGKLWGGGRGLGAGGGTATRGWQGCSDLLACLRHGASIAASAPVVLGGQLCRYATARDRRGLR